MEQRESPAEKNPQVSHGGEDGQQEPAATPEPGVAETPVTPGSEAPASVKSDPSEFTPPSNELAAETPDDGISIYQAMDAWDEKTFVEGAQSDATAAWFYEFDVWEGGQKKKLLELSAVGVFECIRRLNLTPHFEIAIDPSTKEFEGEILEGIPHITCTIAAVDKKNGTVFMGTSQQPLKMKIKDKTAEIKKNDGKAVMEQVIEGGGKVYRIDDTFARSKALTKAQRNALRPHIPSEMRQVLEAQAADDDKKIQRIKAGPGAEKIAELPPPLTDERADELREQARALNRKIHSYCPGGVGVLLPAGFNAQMLRVEHSHERLGDFVVYMEGKVEEAKALAAEREKAAKKK